MGSSLVSSIFGCTTFICMLYTNRVLTRLFGGGGAAQPFTQFVPPSSGIQPAPLSLYGSTQTLTLYSVLNTSLQNKFSWPLS